MTAYAGSYRQGVLDDACRSIRAGRTANGYPYDIAEGSVWQDERNILLLSPDVALPVFMVQPTDRGTSDYTPSSQVKDRFIWVVTARQDATESMDADRKTKVGEKLFAQVELAITDDFGGPLHSGITRGGNCVDSKIRSRQMLQSVGPDSIVIVVMMIESLIYRTYGNVLGP